MEGIFVGTAPLSCPERSRRGCPAFSPGITETQIMLATYHDSTFEEIISILKESVMPNPFCHVELNTTDVKKAKDFYGKLFNWKLEDLPAPTPGGDHPYRAGPPVGSPCL